MLSALNIKELIDNNHETNINSLSEQKATLSSITFFQSLKSMSTLMKQFMPAMRFGTVNDISRSLVKMVSTLGCI